MYKVKVNGQYDFELDSNGSTFRRDGELLDLDLSELSNGHFHVLYKHKSYNIELVSAAEGNKKAIIKINGKVYQAGIEDRFDRLLKELGLETVGMLTAADVKAPMPGLVLKVNVTAGQEVKKGDNLLVLEAMKMENLLKSTTEGTVKTVHVIKGDKVEKNQVLITFV